MNGFVTRLLMVCLLPVAILAVQTRAWGNDSQSPSASDDIAVATDTEAVEEKSVDEKVSAKVSVVSPDNADSQPLDADYLVFDEFLENRGIPAIETSSVTQTAVVLPKQSIAEQAVTFDQVEPAGFFTPMPTVAYPVDRYYLQVLPDGLIYKSYLAGSKESRLSAHLIERNDDGFIWDATLGGRIGIIRWGNADPVKPAGWQIDVEGSAQVRLDINDDVDVRSVDYRAGMLLTHGDRWQQTKFGYYHLSSHLGDEFLLKNPMFPRLNFARDVLVLGRSVYLTDEFRVYGEVGYAFYYQVAKPWEFQFGFDYAPAHATGVAGAPFFAVNGHLREEVNFGGNFVIQGGWAWRGDASDNLLRAGIHYYNGESPQFSFYDDFEQQIGFGLWYDY